MRPGPRCVARSGRPTLATARAARPSALAHLVENAPARPHVQVIARTDPGRGRLREASAPATPRARSRPMAIPHQHQSPVRNGLLAALPPEDLARLRPSLQPVELPFDQTLFPADGTVEAVLFPESGMVSLLATLEDGEQVEVGIVGPGGPGRPAPRLRRRPLAGRGQGADGGHRAPDRRGGPPRRDGGERRAAGAAAALRPGLPGPGDADRRRATRATPSSSASPAGC